MPDSVTILQLWCPWCLDLTWHTFVPFHSFICLKCRGDGRDTHLVTTEGEGECPPSLDSGYTSARSVNRP